MDLSMTFNLLIKRMKILWWILVFIAGVMMNKATEDVLSYDFFVMILWQIGAVLFFID